LTAFEQLDERKKLLVYRYIEDFNLTRAAKEIGVSPGTAKKYLNESLVRRFYQHVLDDQREISLINKSMVESYLMELKSKVNGEEEIPLVTAKGEPYTAKVFDSGAALRLVAAMSKHAGVDTTVRAPVVNINFNNMGVSEDSFNATIDGDFREINGADEG